MKMNKGRRNFYFRPGVVQLKSNFRHWNSSRILHPLIFFPREISLSFPLIFLVVTLHRFARRSGSSGIFILRRFEWLARNCLASRTLGKLERFAFIDFSFFFYPLPLSYTYTDRYIFVLWFFILPFVFLFCTGFTLLHDMSDRHRSRIKSNRRFNIDGPSSFNFRPDVLVFLRTFLRGSDMLWGNRFPFFFCLRQREILLTVVSFRSPAFPPFFFLWFLFPVVHQGEIDLQSW